MSAISHQSLAAAGCKPSSEYRSKPPVSLAEWAQCPPDVWIAASLSHHSRATLGVLHCGSREAQQAYGGSGVWQNHPMTCGWAVVQTLVCVLWEEGQIKGRENGLSLVG